MKYFVTDDSLNEKIIGSDFPQVYKFIKGYDEDAPNALSSLSRYRETFPDYTPDLDGLKLAGHAKLTDFISNGFNGDIKIMSPKAKNVLEKHTLCPNRFYPLGLYKRKVKYDYFLFKTISDYSDFVDYKSSTFKEYNIANNESSAAFFVKSKEDFLTRKENIKQEREVWWTIWGDRIVMNKNFNRDLDLFVIGKLDFNLYVSERLKNAIETAGLTGWEFTPATNLIVEDL